MRPTEQTRTGGPASETPGNCFSACVASILEVSLEDVPHHVGEDWWERWQEWLAERNLGFLSVQLTESGELPLGWYPDSYALLAADSPRGPWLHCVVWKGGEIVWDPSPERSTGVGQWRDLTWIVPLDPAGLLEGKGEQE